MNQIFLLDVVEVSHSLLEEHFPDYLTRRAVEIRVFDAEMNPT